MEMKPNKNKHLNYIILRWFLRWTADLSRVHPVFALWKLGVTPADPHGPELESKWPLEMNELMIIREFKGDAKIN